MPIALIDADIIAFRASAANEQAFTWEPGEVSKAVDVQRAQQAAVETVDAWMKLAGCKECICCFTGLHNFRKLVLPTYKGNRVKGKPEAYWQTVEAVQERFPCRTVDGLEADDVLGILATTDKYLDSAIVVTLDKDLKTVPGRHFNPNKDTKARRVTDDEADYGFLMQALHGDTTDGYTGIPKIGPAKAAAILGGRAAPAGTLWPAVVAAYAKAGLGEQQALQQTRVARILRRSDYDKSTKTIRLWHPTQPELLRLEDVTGTAKGKQ